MEPDSNRPAAMSTLGPLERKARSDIRLPPSTPGESDWKSVDVAMHPVPANARAIVRTAGGGGWGSPLERELEKVRMDVPEGVVSPDAARKEYGVVMKPDFDVDEEATRDLRERIKKEG